MKSDQIDALVTRVKSNREARGLKSTYTGADGKSYDMFHATEAHKAFWDFKKSLKAKYPTAADVPASDMEQFRKLHKAMVEQ